MTLFDTAILDVNDQTVTVGSLTGGVGTLDLGAGGDISAGGDITLTSITLLIAGNGDNTIDSTAGTLTTDAITKNDTGSLSLGGNIAIVLNGTIDVNAGNLTIQDAFTATNDLTASGDIDLGIVAVTLSGTNQLLDAEGGELIIGGFTKTVAGNVTLGGGGAGGTDGVDIGGSIDIQMGSLTITDKFFVTGDLTASTDITFGAGVGTFDGGAADQTVNAGGNITDGGAVLTKDAAANDLILVAGGDIGVDTSNRLGVSAINGAAVKASATGSDIFMESATDLLVEDLTTANAQSDIINILTTGTASLTLAGPYTNVASDTVTLSSAGDLTFQTNPLPVTTGQLSVTFGTQGASSSNKLDLDVIISDSDGVTISGSAGSTDTIDAAGLSVQLDFAATGTGTGTIATGLTATYNQIETIISGSNTGDSFSGNTSYTVNAANGGTANNLTGTWAGIENLIGTGGNDTFNFANSGSIAGSITDGGGGTDDTLSYSTKNDADVTVTLTTGATTATVTGVTGTVSGIEEFVGSLGGNDTLAGRNEASTWTIDGGIEQVDDVTVPGGTRFSAFENLTGNAQVDTFNFPGVTITLGTIKGGSGDDVFNLTRSGGNDTSLTANLEGEGNADTFNFGIPTGTPPGGVSEGSHLIGSISGAAANDTIDFSGSDLSQTVSASGGNGTITGTPDLIMAGFTSIQTIVDNGLSGFGGPNAITFWNITGTNTGTWGTSLATIAANPFIGVSISAGSAADTFIFQAAGEITSGIDGGGDTNILMGSIGADLFTIMGTSSVDVMVGANTTALTSIANIDSTAGGGTFTDTGADVINLNGNSWTGTIHGGGGTDTLINTNFTVTGSDLGTATNINGGGAAGWQGIENLTGTSAADSFTFNAGSVLTGDASGMDGDDTFTLAGSASVVNLLGGDAADTFDLATFTLTGAIDGGSGAGSSTDNDTLTGSNNYIVTGTDTGTSTNVSGGFAEVENLTGTAAADSFTFNGGSVLTGDASGLNGDDSFTLAGSASAANLLGGDAADTFTLAGFTLTGAIDGGSGAGSSTDNDTLTGSNNYIVTGTGTDTGTSTNVSGGFAEVENLTGTAAADSFTFNAGSVLTGDASGLNGDDSFTLAGSASAANLLGGDAADTFTLAGFTLTGAIDGGSGAGSSTDNDTLVGSNDYQITGADTGTSSEVSGGWSEIENLTGTTGDDVFTVGGTLSGTIDGLGESVADLLTGDTSYAVSGMFSGSSGGVNAWTAIENLTGTAGVDTFTFTAGGELAGTASALGGNDIFNITGSGATSSTAAANLFGGDDNDTFNFNGGGGLMTFTGDVYGFDITNPMDSTDDNTFNFTNGKPHIVGMLEGGREGGAGDDDVIDFSGSVIQNTWNTGPGTFVGIAGDPPLISGGWNDADLIPNASGGTISPFGNAVDTYWLINGTDAVVAARSLQELEDFVLNGNSPTTDQMQFSSIIAIQGGDALDLFIFEPDGALTNAADGGGSTGVNTLMGSINPDTFTITGLTALNITVDVGGNGGTASFTTINNIDALAGDLTVGGTFDGAGSDVNIFNVAASNWTGTIGGGVDTDTLQGSGTYVITGSGVGTSPDINGGMAAGWQGIENLTGTSGADSFTFNGGSVLTGDASGLDGDDSFTLAGSASAANLLGGDAADTFNLATFTLTGAINGGSGAGSSTDNDTLTGSNNYIVTGTGTDTGTSTNVSGGFAEVENLTGTAAADSFTFNAGSVLTGDASGLNGDDSFTLAGSASAANLLGGDAADTFTLAGFTLTGAIDGGSGAGSSTDNDTLTGSNNYIVTGMDTGTSTNVSGGFAEVENLTGTAAADSFTFNAGSVLTGDASGLNGDDSFTLAGSASAANLLGGDAADTFNLATFTLTGAINGGSGAGSSTDNDTLTGSNNYIVTGTDTGTSTNVSGGFAEVENLTGTAAADSFTFNAGSVLTGDASGLNGDDSFTLAGSASAANLLGGDAADTFNLATFTLTGAINGGSGAGSSTDNDTLTGSNNYFGGNGHV